MSANKAVASGKQVRIERRAAERVRAGHLWVYRTEVLGGSGGVGELVEVVDERGRPLGSGTYSSSSAIAVRLFARGAIEGREAFLELVGERVQAALRLREELAPRTQTNDGRRLIFSEADGLPGVVLDQYGDLLLLQLLTQGVAQEDVRGAISEALKRSSGTLIADSGTLFGRASGGGGEAPAEGEPEPWTEEAITVWERPDARTRELEELPAPSAEPVLVMGEGEARSATIFRLNGLGFHYDVGAGQKTGAFLDQRLNYRAAAEATARAMASVAGGAARRALDVCTYQGGFALHLARVCERVTGVDASRAALEVADRNLELNRAEMVGATVDWIEADAFELLRAFDEAGERFGAVVLDPPAFAKSKRAAEGAMRGYKELNLRALKMIEPGGVLVTCSCSHHVSESMFREAVAAAAQDAGRRVQVLESRGAAPDHPEVLGLPETRYLKCLICRVG